jgi:hypothetical protein
MADFDGKVLGAGLLRKRLDSLKNRYKAGVRHGLNLASADLLGRSAALAPILTGDLIRSGRVIPSRPSSDVYRSTVAYGTNHALWCHYAHYNLGPISRRKTATEDGPVGRMFLRRPFDKHKEQYVQFIISAAARGPGSVRASGLGGARTGEEG